MTDERRPRLRTPWLDERPGAARSPQGMPAEHPGPPLPRKGGGNGNGNGRPPRPGAPEPPPAPIRSGTGTPTWVSAAVFISAVLYLGGLVLAVGGNSEAMGAIISAPLLMLIAWFVAKKLADIDRNPDLVPILMGATCLKLVGSVIRYWVAANLYGTGDFYDYDKFGRRVAAGLRHGHLITLPGRLAGTNFMRLVTGFIYFATPSRMMSGFLVYGFLSLVGLLFFWRAYRTAVSATNDVRYLKWLVLLPSLLYWPSAIGKDAFMLLAAGIAAYGAACILSDRLWTGIGALSVGMLGMLMVRPHFALAACGGLMLALLFRRQRGGIVQTVVSVAFVVALGFVVVQSASSFFGISAFNQASVVKALNEASTQTGQGGSQFTPVIVNSPIKIPLAAITVLYRPLPFEAHSGQEMITAIEGSVLVILTLKSWRQIKRALAAGRRMPYFLYCTGALLVFIIAFSGFSNFGILARERTVIQPLFLVFIALPADFDDQGAPRREAKLPPPELGRARW